MHDKGLPFFKGLITSIEKSNPNFVFQFGVENNEKTLAGKKFGAVMGREQFMTNEGKLRWTTKIFQIRSIEGLKDAEVPEDRPYQEAEIQKTEAVKARNNDIPFVGTPGPDGFMNIPDSIDEELPFN